MSGLDTLYTRPGFLLRRAHQIAVTLFLNELDDKAVTTTQYGVLVILRHCEGLDQIALSKKVGLDRTTTALVVSKLEHKGLAVRMPDPNDGRRKVIVLTGRGERMLERLKAPAKKAQERALSVFSADEAEEFVALLDKVVAHFNTQTRAPILHQPPEAQGRRARARAGVQPGGAAAAKGGRAAARSATSTSRG